MAMTDSLEVLWCRTFQAVLKVGNYFMGYRMPTYLEGPGKIRELGAFLKEKNINDVLVVTGTGMVRRGQVQPLLDGFESAGIRYTLQAFDHPDPSSDDVELGFKTYKENGCKALVALGGGSRIDCAKGIAAKAVHPKKKVSQLQGLLKVHWPIPPFVAIPTTAGAGSETTVAAVITDSATHRKAAINDPFLIPKYAVLDPELTVGLPPYTTATTGMDALAHAVEAYTNHTYNTKLENRLAKEAVKLIHDNILVAFEDGANLEARQNMQRGAFEAHAVASLAGQDEVCHELHLHLHRAFALTLVAASAVGIEGEESRRHAHLLCQGLRSHESADFIVGLDVRDRIGARRFADGVLIDEIHGGDGIRISLQRGELPRAVGHLVEVKFHGAVENVADEA